MPPTSWQVADASLNTLKGLVDNSLVHYHPGGRFRIHALLRQFAAGELERAGETEDTREHHLAYFLHLAGQAEPEIWRDQEKIWLDRLETEHDNLRKALEWGLSPGSALGVNAGLCLVAAIEQFLMLSGHYRELAGWLAALIAHPQSPEYPTFANCLRMVT